MTTVSLVYPYFRPKHDKSIFRFPPLGLGYIASHLMQNGISTDIVDCTFLTEKEAAERVKGAKPKIVGIYSMFSMKGAAIHLAELFKNDGTMLVAGGPLPTLCPDDFIEHFDAVAVGEGEKTMLELVQTVEGNRSLSSVKGIAHKSKGSKTVYTQPREFMEDLDSLPFPARDLFDNQSYKTYYSKKFGYTSTSLITSRGCPFNCDFCSRAIFGNKFRARSATNVVNEVESVKNLGYDRVWFADDCFTLNRSRLLNICEEMVKRKLEIDWECLSRVDTIDPETALMMKKAGCVRVFFGIESGNDKVLALMKKKATTAQAKRAVLVTKYGGIQTGAFFIVGYPGETDQTVLETLKFASSLPLDYLSFTVPYPIPGTPLYDRVKDSIEFDDFSQPRHRSLTDHKLIYRSTFSENKLKFAILKGTVQFKLKKYFGAQRCQWVSELFNRVTDWIFKLLR